VRHQLVDVGVTWYTWLEQGRDVHPSSALLHRVAEALKLSNDDRRHLFDLALPVQRTAKTEAPSDDVLDAVVRGFTSGPAFVRNSRYDLSFAMTQ
jgi:hypothetical protein